MADGAHTHPELEARIAALETPQPPEPEPEPEPEPSFVIMWGATLDDWQNPQAFPTGPMPVSEFFVYLSPNPTDGTVESCLWDTNDGEKLYQDNGHPWREKINLGAGHHTIKATINGDTVVTQTFEIEATGPDPTPQPPPPDTSDWKPVYQPVPTSFDQEVRGGDSTDIQRALNAAPNNGVVVIRKHNYDLKGTLKGKPGQKVIAEPGTVLDAHGRDFIGWHQGADGMVHANYEIRNLQVSHRGGAAWGDNYTGPAGVAKNWQVLSCKARNIGVKLPSSSTEKWKEKGQAVRGSSGWRVAYNDFGNCFRYTVSLGGSGWIVEHNWMHDTPGRSGDSGNTKFAQSNNAIIRHNLITDHRGNGIWPDINNRNFEIYGNVIRNCGWNGIFYEVSCGPAKIYDNDITNVGWLQDTEKRDQIAGIRDLNSKHIEVYNNVVRDSRYGFVAKWWSGHSQVQKIHDRGDHCDPLSLEGVVFHHNQAINCTYPWFTNQPGVVVDRDNSWN